MGRPGSWSAIMCRLSGSKLNLKPDSGVYLRCIRVWVQLREKEMRGSSLNQAAASFYPLALKKLRASVRCPFCHTSKWRWFPVEFPVVPT